MGVPGCILFLENTSKSGLYRQKMQGAICLICLCMHACIYVGLHCICVCKHPWVCMYICRQMCMSLYMCVYASIYKYVCRETWMMVYLCMYVCVYVFVYVGRHTWVCIHVCMYVLGRNTWASMYVWLDGCRQILCMFVCMHVWM